MTTPISYFHQDALASPPEVGLIRGIGHSFILKERLQCYAADGGVNVP